MVFAGLEEDFRHQASPVSPKTAIDDETITLLVQQFLDEWHYRIMNSSLGKKWPRRKAVRAALQILALNGLQLTDEDVETLTLMDESVMIEEIVQKAPHPMREHFDHLNLQLQMVLAMLVRIRGACETGENLQAIMEESDKTGIGQQVLKQSVVSASKDVADLHRCRITWTRNMDQRLDRLTRSQEFAEHASQQLMAVQTQLELFGLTQGSKNKAVLQGLAERSEATLKHAVFSHWLGYMMWARDEKQIRAKYTKQIEDAVNGLESLKTRVRTNVESIVDRLAQEVAHDAYCTVLAFWHDFVEASKAEKAAKAQIEEMEQRLMMAKEHTEANNKQLFMKVAQSMESNLLSSCMNAWIQFSAEYKKDLEFESQVKATEKLMKENMEKKKSEARIVLERMAGTTDSVLLQTAFREWHSAVRELIAELEREEQMMTGEYQLKACQQTQKENAHAVQGTVNEQMDQNLLTKVMASWNLETKIKNIHKYYTAKMESKRRQLNNVQTLFKSFAQELESGLGNVDGGDSSGRTRLSKPRGGGGSRMQESVSLPDIHQRHG